MIAHSDLLEKYVGTVSGRWNPEWDVDGEARARLASAVGDGLVSFLCGEADGKYVVAKTPRVDNLDRFFTFFPDARLIILVRDGRAVLESGIKSFGWYRDAALHRLADAARTIAAFDEKNRNSSRQDKYRIVRYEDLWTRLEESLRELFEFLDLDPEVYDFAAARDLPVRGSSTVRRDDQASMHWEPVEKTSTFDPMSRFRHWGRGRHERFNRVAGRCLEPFGYTMTRFESKRWRWAMVNLLLDLKWQVVKALGPIYLRLKGERR